MRIPSLMAIIATVSTGLPAQAQDLQVAREISAIAKDICFRPRDYGVTVTQSGQAKGSISTGAIVRRFGQAGLSATQKSDATRYSGVPQSALPTAAADYNRCAQNMVVFLTNSFVVARRAVPRPKSLAPKQPAPTPQPNNTAPAHSEIQQYTPPSEPEPLKRLAPPERPLPQMKDGLVVEITRVQRTAISYTSYNGTKYNYDSLMLVVKISSDVEQMKVSIPFSLSASINKILTGWSFVNEQGTNCDATVLSVAPSIPLEPFPSLHGATVTSDPIIFSAYARCDALVSSVPVNIKMRFSTYIEGDKGRGIGKDIDFNFQNVSFEG